MKDCCLIIRIHIYIHTHIYTYLLTHTHTHIYIYIYIYKHVDPANYFRVKRASNDSQKNNEGNKGEITV